MKRGVILVTIVAFLAGALLVLSSRRGTGDAGPTPLPPVAASTAVVADGTVLPVRRAELAFAVPGRVVSVSVAEGDRVTAGDLLVSLDDAAAMAAVTAANGDVARAEAGVSQAQAAVAGAGAQVQVAKEAAGQADAAVSGASSGVAVARAAVDQAEAMLDKARAAKDLLPSDAPEAQADAADADIGLAEAQLRAARSQVSAASAEQHAAQHAAAIADAQVDAASAARDETEAALAAARAAVDAAAATADQAQAALDDLSLEAPFTATVTSVAIEVGGQASPTRVVVRMADLSAWEIVTTDLDEAGVATVTEGDRATLTFDALPDVEIAGTVSAVGLFGEPFQGTIVYPVTVVPDGPVDGLRWGFTATVSIPSSPVEGLR